MSRHSKDELEIDSCWLVKYRNEKGAWEFINVVIERADNPNCICDIYFVIARPKFILDHA